MIGKFAKGKSEGISVLVFQFWMIIFPPLNDGIREGKLFGPPKFVIVPRLAYVSDSFSLVVSSFGLSRFVGFFFIKIIIHRSNFLSGLRINFFLDHYFPLIKL